MDILMLTHVQIIDTMNNIEMKSILREILNECVQIICGYLTIT
jgi:hypothetical protein